MERSLLERLYRCEKEHWWWQARWTIIADIVRRYSPHPSPLILDAGCSTGALWAFLPPAAAVIGCDLDEEGLRQAPRRAKAAALMARLNQLPLPPASVDFVLVLDVVEHVETEGPVLEALRQTLKPGGILIATVPAHAWLWSGWDDLNHHFRRYSRAGLISTVRQSGFEILFASYFCSILFPPFLVARGLQRLLRARQDALDQARIPRINRLLEWLFSLERYALRSSVRLPFGSSILLVARAPGRGREVTGFR